ncbi:putative monovalent cation/H+ antiporter subunit G [Sphingobium herbicidovorans NBRC 16415]|uniref:Monovalent cation/H+ antiporter subunit G n=1 Tax=Sphingobium herbicidovorans (strain ATCC 700291 / DSM 11019 / CCUG 56400 / KCTC 2939 / LMG 18315 / NBRC 16415 / MH) TaxID=1219045 RepID=A0A086P9A7_SPHHM|nr:monovalent cation/H(+) antiporter subunit G [Sphingobium herbicidovorans]KFG89975.1 putative monovalent cation/H+ antiporter subunit G [Sphingobium herbicidovorans NBRC 16415]
MIQAPDLPGWAAALVALLLLSGALAALVGSIGLLRMRSFYDRVHPPTLGSTLGMALIVLASIICFSVLRSRPSIHEILIGLFLTVTTPVAFMLLARAALYRERVEGDANPGLVDEDGK